ncbi:hypothetical protein LCI18_007534 [Fusarium solani-melongenae]|uniref:Uncharacterized protein n=1 Tax=Fusarium solani subsp. cucurbitae TaxID=2747967 RepID=A0ACD3Z5S6_FUSSC|nr:hypothetical protein LCI18_007534 [Fusarium solani-melongenae]
MSRLKKPTWSALSFALKAFLSLFVIILLYQAYWFYNEREGPYPVDNVLENDAIPLLHPHGGSECLPTLNSSLIAESNLIRRACQQLAPYPMSGVRVATVTAHFGTPQEHYQRALQNHLLHSMIHETRLEVMCHPVVDSLWNKPAFILSLLLDEMMKPAEDRLEWLFWVDRDTLILDQCRPISSFLPPSISSEHHDTERRKRTDDETHLLVTNDWNGLNNGVFLVRVNQWAIELFSDIAAFRYYRPNVSLPFTEQSAMEIVMSEPRFQRNVQLVPQEWFNSYPKGTPTEFQERRDEEGLKHYHARRGDFLVHFAGRPGREKLINGWTKMLKRTRGVWKPEQVQRNATQHVQDFWSKLGF